MQGFRIQASRFLLTFPQCNSFRDAELNLVLGFHYSMGLPLSYYLLSRELHQDGGVHFHLVLVYKDKVESTDPRFFDWMFDGSHANIKTIRHGSKDMKRAVEYVKKDKDFVEDGVAPIATPKESVSARLSALILAGKTLEEIDREEHVAMLMMGSRVRESIQRFQLRRDDYQPWVPPKYSRGLQFGSPQEEAEFNVKVWLDENIRKPRDYRAPHLWLWGEGKIGKTRLVSQLSTMLKVFNAPLENKEWLTGYTDEYDVVVFDDYKSSKSVTFLKQFLQAYPMQVAQKGYGPYLKKFNVPCIFTSNKDPVSAYHRVAAKDPQHFIPFLERLKVVNIGEFNLFP